MNPRPDAYETSALPLSYLARNDGEDTCSVPELRGKNMKIVPHFFIVFNKKEAGGTRIKKSSGGKQ